MFHVFLPSERERIWRAPAHQARHLRGPTEECTETRQCRRAVSAALPVCGDSQVSALTEPLR
jgi:hypothetical protein